MRSLILLTGLLTASLIFAVQVSAGELDNEKAVTNQQIGFAKNLPGTVVVRIKDGAQFAEVLHANDKLAGDSSSHAVVEKSSFLAMTATQKISGHAVGELDQDSSTSSWYFYFNNYNYYCPTYYYYGYTYSYSAYYSYYYAGYSYYYYGWR